MARQVLIDENNGFAHKERECIPLSSLYPRRNATSLAFLVLVEDTLAWSCARNTRGPDQTLRREKVFELEAHRVNAKEEEKQREKDK